MSELDPIGPPAGAPKQPSTKPTAAKHVAEPASNAPEQVKARFVDVQAVLSPTQGIICYGDAFMVSPEQLEQDPRFIAWSDNWTPDPALLAASELEG